MNFLKRATPWMITLVILLGAYWASYVWWYKPKPYGSYDKRLDQFYHPMNLWEQERAKQNARKELLRECQGDWEGFVKPRSEDFTNHNQLTRVRATIQGDQFNITWAESMHALVGVSWKIGCIYDIAPNIGFSSNADYPKDSSIILSHERLPTGEESLKEGKIVYGPDGMMLLHETTDQLLRPAARVSSPSNN